MTVKADTAFAKLYDHCESTAISLLPAKPKNLLKPMALCVFVDKRWKCAKVEPDQSIEAVAERMLKALKV